MTNQRPWEKVNVPASMKGEPDFPLIQWVHQPFRLKPTQENGGFFLPKKYGVAFEKEAKEAKYGQDEGTFTRKLRVCIIAIRASWVRKESGVEIRIPDYVDGARKRMHALLIIEGYPDSPMVFTTIGRVNDGLAAAYQALTTIAKSQGAEPWMFWVDLKAGSTGTSGEHDVMTTPLMVQTPNVEELEENFIGEELITNTILPLSDDIKKWREDWNGDGINDNEDFADDSGSSGMPQMTWEQALAVSVKTQDGAKTFGTIIQDDDYGRRVISHILSSDTNFTAEITSAAQVIHDELYEETTEEGEGDDIPF